MLDLFATGSIAPAADGTALPLRCSVSLGHLILYMNARERRLVTLRRYLLSRYTYIYILVWDYTDWSDMVYPDGGLYTDRSDTRQGLAPSTFVVPDPLFVCLSFRSCLVCVFEVSVLTVVDDG